MAKQKTLFGKPILIGLLSRKLIKSEGEKIGKKDN